MSSWTLVTGGNGFLAGHLIRALLAEGRKVKALVGAGADLRSLEGLPRDRFRVAQGEVQIVDRVFAALSDCDSVVHLAGSTDTDEARRRDVERLAVRGTSAVLEAARRAALERVVVVGCVTGQGATEVPSAPATAASGREKNVQATSQRALEGLALEALERGAPVVWVRSALLVGAGDSRPSLGGALVLAYLRRSLTLPMPLIPGGAAWLGAGDAAQGLVRILTRGRVGERYSLGGENLTHRELLTQLGDVTGLADVGDDWSPGAARWATTFARWSARWSGSAPPRLTTALLDDYYGRYLYLDDTKTREELGLTPRPLRESLREAARWYAEHGYLSEANVRALRLDPIPPAAS